MRLVHMNGRVQDPILGRFVSADPTVPSPFNGQSLNRYSYVENRPLSLVDPSGFTPIPVCSGSAADCVGGRRGLSIEFPYGGDFYASIFWHRQRDFERGTPRQAGTLPRDPGVQGQVVVMNSPTSAGAQEAELRPITNPLTTLAIADIPILSRLLRVADASVAPLLGLGRGIFTGDFTPYGLLTGLTPTDEELTTSGVILSATGSFNLVGSASLAGAAQVTRNRAAGLVAEAQAAKDLVAQGNTVLGSHVSVRTSQGRRVIDHLIQDAFGIIRAIEVKFRTGMRNASQLAKDRALATEGGIFIGKNAPRALRGQRLVIETIELRY